MIMALPRPVHTTIAGLLMAAATATPIPSTASPSYDCRKASIPAEFAICASDHLSYLDRRMADRYGYMLRNLSPVAAQIIRFDQQEWLDLRNSCGSNYNCLAGAYHLRMAALGL